MKLTTICELNFNYNNGALDLALSGANEGSRCFALLLALGKRLETPLRVVDELDVSLDPVDRKIALDTLVDMAKRMGHRQYIFITPQDLSVLQKFLLLKMYLMKPPFRKGHVGGSQRALDFSQASDEYSLWHNVSFLGQIKGS